jgi:pentatricopeptide repeat protein
MEEAKNTLDKMKQAKQWPNLRTYNTILRGCVRWADVATAQQMYYNVALCLLTSKV